MDALNQYAPGMAAFFAGINQRQGEDTNRLKQQQLAQIIQGLQAEASRSAELHPLELDQRRLANDSTRAQIPGLQAASDLSGTKARVAAATADSDIDEKKSENTNKMQQRIMQELGVIGQEMEGVPDLDKPRYLAEAISSRGYPSPEGLLKRFSHVKPADLPKALQSISNKYLRSTPAYAQAVDTTNITGEYGLKREKLQGANQMAVEQAGINAGKYANRSSGGGGRGGLPSDLATRVIKELAGKPVKTQLAVLQRAIIEAKQSGDEDLANRFYAQAMALKQQYDNEVNQPRAGSTDMGAMGKGKIPVHPPSDIQITNPSAEDTKPQPGPVGKASNAGPFTDAEKERRYQEWKRRQQSNK